MANFKELLIAQGFGEVHFNRFRVAFRRPPNTTAQTLAGDFVMNFPKYLDSPHATVIPGPADHDGKPTLKFHGPLRVLNVDVARPHNDWVFQFRVDMTKGFTAQTLKRLFIDWGEDFAAGAGDALVSSQPVFSGPVAAIKTVTWAAGWEPSAIEINRRHFLCGRRAWRLDEGAVFGVNQPDVLVLETAALERFSHPAFAVGDRVMGLEAIIPSIWIANLNNFMRYRNLTRVPQRLRNDWKTRDGVDYLQLNFADLTLGNSAEAWNALRIFPDLLP